MWWRYVFQRPKHKAEPVVPAETVTSVSAKANSSFLELFFPHRHPLMHIFLKVPAGKFKNWNFLCPKPLPGNRAFFCEQPNHRHCDRAVLPGGAVGLAGFGQLTTLPSSINESMVLPVLKNISKLLVGITLVIIHDGFAKVDAVRGVGHQRIFQLNGYGS